MDNQQMEKLLLDLKSSDSRIINDTITRLVALGEPVIPRLIELLNSKLDLETRSNSALALGKFTDNKNEILEVLKKALKISPSYVRSGIVVALGDLGDERGIPLLVKAMKDRDKSVSHLAARALSEIGGNQVVEQLISLLKNNKNYVRANASYALGLIGDVRAVEPLIEVLQNDSCNWVRSEGAAISLGWLGDKRALETLLNALSDEDAQLRYHVVTALGLLGAVEALPMLQQVYENDSGEIRDGDDTVKGVAAWAIEKINQRLG